MRLVTLKGYALKDGKIKRIEGYGLNASAKIARKKSKRVRVVKRGSH